MFKGTLWKIEATGEHKVVRLFKDRVDGQTTKCEVCTIPSGSSSSSAESASGWRPCTGRVPSHAVGFVAAMPPVFIGGHLYWPLEVGGATNVKQPAILSFSTDAEKFQWVQTPPARRICHLTDFDGSLCAAVDVRHEINKYVFFTQSGGSWTVRCCIDSQSLTPRATSDEFMEERDVVPLCSAAGGKVMLATGRHKVFAYDPERRVMERVFYAREFVDVSRRHRDDARLRLSFVLHEEHIHQPSSLRVQQGEKKLQVKLGSNDTVDKREVVDEHRDDHFRRLGDFFKQMAGLPLPPHMTNSQPNY
ncbi:hypothetical protein QOZ80_9AG0674200 [Eleusine coracana subsp. coracana]|nr:hypothetical protein QOZ80_9AG0674200 [Eleusine coracana subsp. coracana]